MLGGLIHPRRAQQRTLQRRISRQIFNSHFTARYYSSLFSVHVLSKSAYDPSLDATEVSYTHEAQNQLHMFTASRMGTVRRGQEKLTSSIFGTAVVVEDRPSNCLSTIGRRSLILQQRIKAQCELHHHIHTGTLQQELPDSGSHEKKL